MPTTLGHDRREILNGIDLLETQILNLKQELKDLRPEEPGGSYNAVIRFRKFSGGYVFAAIRCDKRWFITQDGSRNGSRFGAKDSWDELLEWIGERNWDSIEELT